MLVDIEVPSVGESVTEGVLAAWSVEDGAWVEKGGTLFELETDKAMQEIPAPETGVVTRLVEAGTTVSIGTVAGRIDTDAKPATPNGHAGSGAESRKAAAEPESAKADAKDGAAGEEKVLATSVAKKIAEEKGIDLRTVKGSGAHGRIRREDVEGLIPAPAPSAKSGDAPTVSGTDPGASKPEVTRERMSTLRKRIAERLVEAQHTAAMLTTFNDVDMSAVMALRKEHKESFKEKYGVGLGFMSFFTKAVVEALREYPRVNSMIDGDETVTHHCYHIGVAVSSDRGLVVPVVRHADRLSFAGIEGVVADYAARARAGKIELGEMQGGTFTVTNGGVFGSLLSTPILNPPQSAILGMHRIEDRPVARNGQVEIRPMMYLALSYDHRIIDGREAVGFLVKIKECIENPARMLLSV